VRSVIRLGAVTQKVDPSLAGELSSRPIRGHTDSRNSHAKERIVDEADAFRRHGHQCCRSAA
jgi:hypothetical protein